ncbi:hypothetical protein [Sinorhizobium meliloti]|uniref:hypothetical protein n=1 Tax=Rhizobium meliloti TaxID=382 RepID=UPI003F5CD4C4
MDEKFFVDLNGNFIGTFMGTVPEGGLEVPSAPLDASQKWQNGAWSAPAEFFPPLTARQLRLGLINNSLAPAQVTAEIEAMPDGVAKETARIEWEYATSFERMHPLIGTVGAALGLDDDQIDAMWTAALSL